MQLENSLICITETCCNHAATILNAIGYLAPYAALMLEIYCKNMLLSYWDHAEIMLQFCKDTWKTAVP